nr:cytochrome c [Dyella choica]
MIRLQLFGLATVAAVVLCSSPAHATGDKKNGRSLVYTCNGCHGVPGSSNAYPQYPVPKIAGQNEQYLLDALHAYKAGQRAHPTMTAQAQSLSDQEIEDIAAYLSSLAPAAPKDSDAQVKKAKDLLTQSDAGKLASKCVSCHGNDGTGTAPQFPRLAGQYNEYIQHVVHEYQNGERDNPIMKPQVSNLSPDDIKQLADYFSTLPTQLEKPDELSTLKGHVQGD